MELVSSFWLEETDNSVQENNDYDDSKNDAGYSQTRKHHPQR